MNPFVVIDEVAVLFVTLLMLCLSTLWYSSYLFGGIWEKESNVSRTGDDDRFYIGIFATFCAYFVLVMFLAYVSAYIQKFNLPLLFTTLVVWLTLSMGALPPYLWEKRSLKLWAVHSGFLGVVSLLGSYLLYVWN
jgi:hypothetical protein